MAKTQGLAGASRDPFLDFIGTRFLLACVAYRGIRMKTICIAIIAGTRSFFARIVSALSPSNLLAHAASKPAPSSASRSFCLLLWLWLGNQGLFLAQCAPVESVTGYVVRTAYIIPSNRTAQSNAVPHLRNALLLYQTWYRDQMVRHGFPAKTFRFETEADDLTPKVRVVNVAETDAYLRADLWDRTITAAMNAGLPIWSDKQVWWLIPETHVEAANGDITGVNSLGASSGSGDDGGVAMTGSDALARLWPPYFTNNLPYHDQVIPEIGPYPLQQGVSFGASLGTNFSSISSTALGAGLHETSHAFGLPHDFRNDQNFKGNLMGNGFRGMRGSIFPDLYPGDFARASYASLLALSVSRFFNPDANYSDNTKPTLSISTTGTNTTANGLLRIHFTASDTGGLHVALLLCDCNVGGNDGGLIGELSLSGTSVATNFATPYFDPGITNKFTVRVYDLQGNRAGADAFVVPRTGFNQGPRPLVTSSTRNAVVGEDVVLSAANSTDPDGPAGSVQVEWDLDNDGVFETAPTTNKGLTNQFTAPGEKLIRVRLTDNSAAQSISTPIAVRVNLPALRVAAISSGVQLLWTTNAAGFQLEWSTNVPANVWENATQPVTVVGAQKTVSVTNDSGHRYFRLRR